MKKHITILISSLLVTVVGIAQTPVYNDTINRMVLVESTYNPILSGAIKHNFIPEEVEPSMKKESIVYADEAVPVSRFERTPRHVDGIDAKRGQSFPGYMHLGFGSHNNLNGLAAYKLLLNDNQHLSMNAGVDGWSGNIRIDNDKSWHSHLHDMDLGVHYRLKMGKADLDVNVDAARYVFNYLAKEKFDMNQDYADAQQAGDIIAGFHLRGNAKEHYYYHLRASYANYNRNYLFGNAKRNAEGHLHVEASFSSDLYEWGIPSIVMRGDWLTYKGLIDYRNYSSLGINPQWDYSYGDFDFMAGMNVDLLARDGLGVRFSPDCRVVYAPDKCFSMDFTVDGGRTLPTFGTLHAMSPYWISYAQLTPSYTYLHAKLTGNMRVMEGLSVSLVGGYKMIENALFQTVGDTIGIVYTKIEGRDAQVFYTEASLHYTQKNFFSLSADASYNHWMMGHDRSLLARTPQLDVNIGARIRVIENLYVNTNCRWVLFTPTEGGTREKSVLNVSLGGHYALNDKLSFFLEGHNLLNRHYQHYTGYPSQGINIMVGAIFKF